MAGRLLTRDMAPHSFNFDTLVAVTWLAVYSHGTWLPIISDIDIKMSTWLDFDTTTSTWLDLFLNITRSTWLVLVSCVCRPAPFE